MLFTLPSLRVLVSRVILNYFWTSHLPCSNSVFQLNSLQIPSILSQVSKTLFLHFSESSLKVFFQNFSVFLDLLPVEPTYISNFHPITRVECSFWISGKNLMENLGKAGNTYGNDSNGEQWDEVFGDRSSGRDWERMANQVGKTWDK